MSPPFSFFTSGPYSIAMSTAPQQDLLSNLVHNRKQWFPTYLLRSAVSPPLRVLLSPAILLCLQFADTEGSLQFAVASPAICSSVGPTPLPIVSGTATSEVSHFSGHTLPPSAYSIASEHSTTHVSPANLAGVLPIASLSLNSTFLESSRTPSASFPHRVTIFLVLEILRLSNYRLFLRGCNNAHLPPI